MSTADTPAVLVALRDRALTYTPLTGPSLASILGTLAAPLVGTTGSFATGSPRFFQNRPPQGVPFDSMDTERPQFYALGTMGTPRTDGDGGDFAVFAWEVTIYGRPESALPLAMRAGDAITRAYLRWVSPDGAIRVLDAPMMAPLPAFPDPADRQVVGARASYTVQCLPAYLSALAGIA